MAAEFEGKEPAGGAAHGGVEESHHGDDPADDAVDAVVLHAEGGEDDAAGVEADDHGEEHPHVEHQGVTGYAAVVTHSFSLSTNYIQIKTNSSLYKPLYPFVDPLSVSLFSTNDIQIKTKSLYKPLYPFVDPLSVSLFSTNYIQIKTKSLYKPLYPFVDPLSVSLFSTNDIQIKTKSSLYSFTIEASSAGVICGELIRSIGVEGLELGEDGGDGALFGLSGFDGLPGGYGCL